MYKKRKHSNMSYDGRMSIILNRPSFYNFLIDIIFNNKNTTRHVEKMKIIFF